MRQTWPAGRRSVCLCTYSTVNYLRLGIALGLGLGIGLALALALVDPRLSRYGTTETGAANWTAIFFSACAASSPAWRVLYRTGNRICGGSTYSICDVVDGTCGGMRRRGRKVETCAFLSFSVLCLFELVPAMSLSRLRTQTRDSQYSRYMLAPLPSSQGKAAQRRIYCGMRNGALSSESRAPP